MDTPQQIVAAVERALAEYDDVKTQIAAAQDAVRALPADTLSGLYDHFLESSIRECVYQRRCSFNRLSKAGEQLPPLRRPDGPGVLSGVSAETRAVLRTAYDSLFLAGKVVGDLTRAELLDFAGAQQRIVVGHRHDARLAGKLAELMPEGYDGKLRDHVAEPDLRKAIKDSLRWRERQMKKLAGETAEV